MSSSATTSKDLASVLPRLRWAWDFGPLLGDVDTGRLLALLTAVAEEGALGNAAKRAGMSYRSAWGLLRACEQALGAPLVVMERGRGTQLTDFGASLVQLDAAARVALEAVHAPWQRRLEELLAPVVRAVPERLRLAASHDLALADWVEHGRRARLLAGAHHDGVDVEHLAIVAQAQVQAGVVDLLVAHARQHLDVAALEQGAADPAGGLGELGDVEADAAGADDGDLAPAGRRPGRSHRVARHLGMVDAGNRRACAAAMPVASATSSKPPRASSVGRGAVRTFSSTPVVEAAAEVAQRLAELLLARDALGQVELAADLVGRVEQRDVVAALGGGGGASEAGRAGADDGDRFGGVGADRPARSRGRRAG
jgi:molybdate transport repressor ModE-like protein